MRAAADVEDLPATERSSERPSFDADVTSGGAGSSAAHTTQEVADESQLSGESDDGRSERMLNADYADSGPAAGAGAAGGSGAGMSGAAADGSHDGQAQQPLHLQSAAGEMVNMADPETKMRVAEGIASALLQELIEDTIQATTVPGHTGGEPMLRHPMPMHRHSVIAEMIFEDSASAHSGDSNESDAQRAAGLRLGAQRGDSEAGSAAIESERAHEREGAATSSSSTDVDRTAPEEVTANAGAAGATLLGPLPAGALCLPFGDIDAPHIASPKDTGPPRPPSPPPTAASVAVTGTGAATGAGASAGVRTREETAELIAGELLDLLLDEVWSELSQGPTSPRVQQDSEFKDSRGGYHGIDTSELVVGPFMDAALQALEVTDEARPVDISILWPPEEWLPSVLEAMRKAQLSPLTRDSEAASGDTAASDGDLAAVQAAAVRERDVANWTQVLMDAMLEIVQVEIQSESKKIHSGWRRPFLGESPLSRFRAQEVEEGNAHSQVTWAKVRQRLAEVVRERHNDGDGDAVGGAAATGADSPGGNVCGDLPQTASTMLYIFEENIDAMVEEEICADEASWLDIGEDVRHVKNQVAQLIFAELIDETAAEIRDIWSS
eukprot:gnl/TRDRNA2_/TRDRNA2_130412_c1_seq1.p1 gnl/TRDRNA2_/TRDRNA2_130412_c1~~gnl/TRDRNA2_/TRDRNA2_130412_c1_seq1.p1  ORF type:complete len:646 (-),score=140.90 gnl/TRDRNA2_/TRDRNA2_130412_c1_seq1:81-1913(-)